MKRTFFFKDDTISAKRSNSRKIDDSIHLAPELGDYQILEKIGSGTFGAVWKGKCISNGSLVALKRLKKTCSPSMALNEIGCLSKLEGKCNVVELLDGIRCQDQITLVLKHVAHDHFNDLVKRMHCEDIRAYMYQLLTALAHVHQYAIIHRDVKPTNFLYSQHDRHGVLVDFGLAEPGASVSVPSIIEKSLHSGVARVAARAGTRGYRAPEVLLQYIKQTTDIDIWSAGVVMLSLLTRRFPFFEPEDDFVALSQIAVLSGSEELKNVATILGKSLTLPVTSPKVHWKDLITRLNPIDGQLFSRDCIDLLSRLLDISPWTRIKAKEALNHPFFNAPLSPPLTLPASSTVSSSCSAITPKPVEAVGRLPSSLLLASSRSPDDDVKVEKPNDNIVRPVRRRKRFPTSRNHEEEEDVEMDDFDMHEQIPIPVSSESERCSSHDASSASGIPGFERKKHLQDVNENPKCPSSSSRRVEASENAEMFQCAKNGEESDNSSDKEEHKNSDKEEHKNSDNEEHKNSDNEEHKNSDNDNNEEHNSSDSDSDNDNDNNDNDNDDIEDNNDNDNNYDEDNEDGNDDDNDNEDGNDNEDDDEQEEEEDNDDNEDNDNGDGDNDNDNDNDNDDNDDNDNEDNDNEDNDNDDNEEE